MEEQDLHIHIDDNCGKTVSKFGVGLSKDVVFINDHPSKTLTVSIQTEPKDGKALCCGDEEIETFTVTPRERKKTLSICRTYEAKVFKYTATLSGSEPEDPVIIIERR